MSSSNLDFKRKNGETKAKAVFKKTMATSFPELMKNMIPQIEYT